MNDSKARQPVAILATEFNNFLFASIGSDRIGGQLSVVSALARLDLDPWDEARQLSQLSGDSASQKLTNWMSRFPELVYNFEDRNHTAKRLIALLPQRILSKTPSVLRTTPDKNVQAARAIATIFVIALFLMYAGQLYLSLRTTAPSSHAQAANPIAVSTPTVPIPGS